MKPGEYQGQDGNTYRWHNTWFKDRWNVDAVDYRGELEHVGRTGIPKTDWPAAKAALDALIESEEGEWVEFGEFYNQQRWQIRTQGGNLRHWNGEKYVDCVNSDISSAYRKGREVALEQVQELVDAIEDGGTTIQSSSVCYAGRYPILVEEDHWKRIRDAARKVKERSDV